MAPAIDRLITAIAAFNQLIMPFLVKIAAVLITAMTIVVVVGVFFRYVLNNSLPWSEEFAIVSAVWVAFLVAPQAYRTGGHVSIELIIQSLPSVLVRVFRIVINLMILWILYRFFLEALTFVKNGNFQRANSMPVKISWFRSVVPVSMAMMFLVGVELILRDFMGLLTGTKERDLPHINPMEPE